MRNIDIPLSKNVLSEKKNGLIDYATATISQHNCGTARPIVLLTLMRRSIRNINITPPGKPRAFELLKIELFKFPPPWAKIAFKYPTLALDLTVKCPPKDKMFSVINKCCKNI